MFLGLSGVESQVYSTSLLFQCVTFFPSTAKEYIRYLKLIYHCGITIEETEEDKHGEEASQLAECQIR
jgi:hypothetical protein